MEELIAKYIEMRDAKAVLNNAYKAKVAKLDVVMDKIEGFILDEFNKQGVESARCPTGTAYKSLRTNASVADWPALLDYVKLNGLWDMLEHRVNKKVVEEFRDEHQDLPPGVNWGEEIVINVRRSA